MPKIKGDAVLKATVYKTVRALMELTCTEQFTVKLQQFMAAAKEDPKTADFACYFEREYASRPEVWAYCYRFGLKVHHNMHLEAMHRVIKHVHLQGIKVRRLDKSIHALMRFLRTKMSDRLLKLHKGKWTRHVGGIRKRHEASLSLNASSCSCLEQNLVYTVQGNNDNTYTVRQADAVPHQQKTCPLLCRDCAVCVHAFSCTCTDSALRNTICKHIHLVMRTYSPVCHFTTAAVPLTNAPMEEQNDAEISTDEPLVPDIGSEVLPASEQASLPDVSESQAIMMQITGDGQQSSDVASCIATADAAWGVVRAAMEANAAIAQTAAEYMTRLKCLVTALGTKPEVPRLPSLQMHCEPANKKAAKQRCFRSVLF